MCKYGPGHYFHLHARAPPTAVPGCVDERITTTLHWASCGPGTPRPQDAQRRVARWRPHWNVWALVITGSRLLRGAYREKWCRQNGVAPTPNRSANYAKICSQLAHWYIHLIFNNSLPLCPHRLRGTLSPSENKGTLAGRGQRTRQLNGLASIETPSRHPLCCTNDLIDMKGRSCLKIVLDVCLHPGNHDTSEASYQKQCFRYDGKWSF